jgi:hypothetical protein
LADPNLPKTNPGSKNRIFNEGDQVAFGPLMYSEYQGWDTGVQVQNLSPVVNAKVKVYFLDRSGDIITTLVDWICPRGSQSFYLPVVTSLPGNWVGWVRVESQEWFTPGASAVAASPITAVAQLIKYANIQQTAANEGVAYNLLPEPQSFDWQLGSGNGGTESGQALIAIPSLLKDLDGTGVTTEVAIANVVPKPGFTDFVIYIYDQNGLVDSLCQKLDAKQVEYIDLASQMAFLPEGFKGSAVISAVFWEHDVWDDGGRFMRNLVGLSAVKLERTGTIQGSDIPGDESAASEGFPIIGPFAFLTTLRSAEIPGAGLGEAAFSAAFSAGFSVEHAVASAPADAARMTLPSSLRLSGAGAGIFGEAVPHVPHPVVAQLPHPLLELLITLSDFSIAFSFFRTGSNNAETYFFSGRTAQTSFRYQEFSGQSPLANNPEGCRPVS